MNRLFFAVVMCFACSSAFGQCSDGKCQLPKAVAKVASVPVLIASNAVSVSAVSVRKVAKWRPVRRGLRRLFCR